MIDPRELPLVDTPSTPTWCENYCFEINCPDSGIGMFVHMSRQDFNHDVWRDLLVMQIQGKQALVWKGYGKGAHAAGAGGAQLRYTCKESFKRWALTFDGAARLVPAAEMAPGTGAALTDGSYVSVRMNLDAAADGDIWDLSKVVEGHAWANDHYEQCITVKGELVIDSKTYVLNGLGVRDHSRGPRNWAGLGSHCWITGGFPGGRRFIVLALDGRPDPAQNQVRAAKIFDANGAHNAEVVDIAMVKNADDGGGLRYTMRLKSEVGDEMFEAEQQQITTIALVSPNQILMGAQHGNNIVSHTFHGPTTFKWNGEMCHGFTERSFPL